MSTESLISSFVFLDTLETIVKNDLESDPSLAIGTFEFRRIINFQQQYAIFQLWFTDDETRTHKQLGIITIQCTSHQENQFAFKGSLNFSVINKLHEFVLIVDNMDRLKSQALKLSIYCKSFVIEAFGDKVLKDGDLVQRPKPVGAVEKIDQEAEKLAEIERRKQERTIQMSPLDLQKELFEEATVEDKLKKAAEGKPNEPLDMSADEIEKMLMGGGDTKPTPVSPEKASSTENSNQPLDMSADEIEKMLLTENKSESPSESETSPEIPAATAATETAATPVPAESNKETSSPEVNPVPVEANSTNTTSAQNADEDFVKQLQSQLSQ